MAGGRGNTGSAVRKQELSGLQSGWSSGSRGAGGWGCADREDAGWRIRNLICGQSGAEGGERTRSSRALAVIRATIPGCPLVPRTVLMIITTMFIDHSPGIGLCFSEVRVFNPPGNPGREVSPFLFTGRLRYVLHVPLLGSGQVRFPSTAACLHAGPALFSITRCCFPWTGWEPWGGQPR